MVLVLPRPHSHNCCHRGVSTWKWNLADEQRCLPIMNRICRGLVLAIALAAGMQFPAAPSFAEPSLLDAHGNVDASIASADTPASRLYDARCASCHEHPQGRIPPRASLRYSPPENVRHALVHGAMRPMAQGLSDAQILSLVVYLTGREPEQPRDPLANACAGPTAAVLLVAGDWTSTHGDESNSRYRGDAGVDAAGISSLRLKWSFAYPGRAAGPVTLAGDKVFLASSSHVVSLDAASGCTRWAHPVDGRIVRSVSLATLPVRGTPGRAVLVFGDDSSTVTALDAGTGEVLWRTRVEEHVLSRITAAPSIHDGRVFAPISGIEDPLTHDPAYECCTSRGGVAALDLATGKLLWKQYHIVEEPTLRSGANETPRRFGPAGASTYTPLAIDAKRGLLYATTAEEYGLLDPRGPYSVIAYELGSGARKWQQQFLPDASARELACTAAAHTDCRNLFSMGTSVTIVTLAGGKQVLAVGQKWGFVYGLDPDRNGEELWRARVAQGGDLGGVMVAWRQTAARSMSRFPMTTQCHRIVRRTRRARSSQRCRAVACRGAGSAVQLGRTGVQGRVRGGADRSAAPYSPAHGTDTFASTRAAMAA
ncbi:MAG: PQQ-binding-like beta-propeller repeat protein [Gammaproteobacteria bacterium]|nr:PQQ-binding-like beta-propeller repeat protein [Gammaproteobacteria bacterium]